MCGISCIVDYSDSLDLSKYIGQMNDRIKHRGPDADGTFIHQNVALGHRRLSILDLSSSGNQPMHYLDKYSLVYNGEIYNYLEIQEELISEGYSFKSKTDTEVLLAAYDFWGEECVLKFNGMWSFVLIDREKNILFGSRDRFAIKPFYYYGTTNFLAIGSEIKQFMDLPGFKPVLNKKVTHDFLAYSYLNISEETFFEGVLELRGGYNVKIDLKTVTPELVISQWYFPTKPVKSKLTFDDASRKVYALFENSVKLRMRSDVPVGASLSGGLDSSSIVSFIKKSHSNSENLETISIVDPVAEYSEEEYIDEVLKHTNVRANKYTTDLDQIFLSDTYDKIIYHQDQPILSSSHFAEYSVFKAAKDKKLTVMLDGQGSDEVFGGYNISYRMMFRDLIRQWRFKKLRSEILLRKRLLNVSVLRSLADITTTYFPAFIALYNRKRSVKNEGVVNPDFFKYVQLNDSLFTKKDAYQETLNEVFYTHMPHQLHSQDRNSMLFSIESRVPFLDFDLVDFALPLPSDFKVKDGASKAVLRDAMKEMIPAAVRERYVKMAFLTPEAVWMKKNSKVVLSELNDAVKYLDGMVSNQIISNFKEFEAGNREHEYTYFRVLSLYRFVKIFKMDLAK